MLDAPHVVVDAALSHYALAIQALVEMARALASVPVNLSNRDYFPAPSVLARGSAAQSTGGSASHLSAQVSSTPAQQSGSVALQMTACSPLAAPFRPLICTGGRDLWCTSRQLKKTV